MVLPNFLIIGTRKAGTSSLYHNLVQHPEIFMPTLKGSRFLLHDPDGPAGSSGATVQTLEEYSRLFAGAESTGARAIGEASPSYFQSPDAARRIRECLPEARLIVSLRNPVDKVYSQYQMNLRRAGKSGPLPPTYEHLEPLMGACFYAKHLQVYLDLFPRRQLKVLVFEQWIRSQRECAADLFRFLGVSDSSVVLDDSRYNIGGLPRNVFYRSLLSARDSLISLKPLVPKSIRKVVNRSINSGMEKAPSLPTELGRRLASAFRTDVAQLEKLTGLDLAAWKLREPLESA